MDKTAAARQNKRIERMAQNGVRRSTVMVHDNCRQALDALRPHLANADAAPALNIAVAALDNGEVVNVSQVRQLSPFRYAGGKTWLVPEVRRWIRSLRYQPRYFIETFAGGGIVGLTVAAEALAERVIMCEIDDDVAAVWQTIINGSNNDADWLCRSIANFGVSFDSVRQILDASPRATRAKAFRTIIKNRMNRGGILAPGAGLMKAGENNKGLLARWYPETLVKRIQAIRSFRSRLDFRQADAFDVIGEYSDEERTVFFTDPPYSAGGKAAGKRLYKHNELDHDMLFRVMATARGDVLLTYDDAAEVRALAAAHGLAVNTIAMKNTHHSIMQELLITKV